MNLRGLGHALQFLTRLPVPNPGPFDPEDLSRSAAWFPLVGAIIGSILAATFWAGQHISPWVAALLTLFAWVWGTGALHLDGLGDVTDALAAAHRSPERFLDVLRDPHVGAFGVIAIVLLMMAKLVLLAELPGEHALAALLLIPAWARWGAQVWSLTVAPLASGSGERFSWRINHHVVMAQGVALCVLSLFLAPALIAAIIIVPAVSLYWKRRLGGITGDCLGASIEVTEALLLLAALIMHRAV